MNEYTEQYSLSVDFPGGLTNHILQNTIVNDVGITPTCIRIDTIGDDVQIILDGQLNAGEKTILDGLVASYVPGIAYTIPDLVIDPTDDLLRRRLPDDSTIIIGTQNVSEVHISADDGVGQYPTISAAVAAKSDPGTIYIVHPGVYIENNPITLPVGSTLRAKGTAGNTTLMAGDLTKDFLILSAWCKISKFIITGTQTPGQKCLGRGLYFDGSSGIGAYSLVEECIITNFDTCVETSGAPTGAHTLLLHRVQVGCTTAPLTNGLYAHTQGQVISNSFVAAGTPVPLSPIPLPFTSAIRAEDPGTKVSVNITSVYYCTHACLIDNGGELEITLLTSTNCDKAISIGGTGTNSKIRAVNFNMKDSVQYDLEIIPSDAIIDLVGAQMDESKIKNDNNVNINAQFNGNKNGKKYQTLTGDLRIGTITEPTNVAIGEGRYNVDSFVVAQNDDNDIGTWTDISSSAKSETDSSIDMFSGMTAGNCLYIGSNTVPRGVKINITTAVTLADVGVDDVIAEYWDGSAWTTFTFMCTEASSPFYAVVTPFVNTVGKYQIRFGLTGASPIAKQIANGEEKYWTRWRIVNDWSSLPQLEYIKIHTNSTEVNKDGFMEYFGDARPVGKLDWSMNLTEPANASPDSQDIFISDSLGIGRKENSFKDNTIDRIGLNEFLPMDIDTGFPIKLKFSILGTSATPGDVEFIARWNFTNEGSTIHRTTVTAPSSSVGEKSNSTIITLSADDTEYRGEIIIDIAGINPNPTDGKPDLFWVSLERDATGANANDTYGGNVIISQMGVYYVRWRDGGHILSY